MKRTPLRRGARIRVKGRARFAGRSDPAYRAWIRQQPCVLADHPVARARGGCRGVIEPCHVKSKGASGGDQANLYPGCSRHHEEQHQTGIRSFQTRYGINLRALATELAVQYAQKLQFLTTSVQEATP